MAFSGNFMCTSFKKELLFGAHDLANGADTLKLALYTNSASFTAATTAYTTSNEVSGTGYTAGGAALASVTLGLADASSVPTAFLDFADTTFSTSTISNARGALIYNSTLANAGTAGTTTHAATPSVCVINFGVDKSSTAGDFTIQYPGNAATTAIIRIG